MATRAKQMPTLNLGPQEEMPQTLLAFTSLEFVRFFKQVPVTAGHLRS